MLTESESAFVDACEKTARDLTTRDLVAIIRKLEAEGKRTNKDRTHKCQCQWEAGDSPCPIHGDKDEDEINQGPP